MIMPGKVWPSVLHRRPVAPQVGEPGSGVSLVRGDEAEEVDHCAAWMQGEELAEGREVGAGAIEGIVPRQHQLVLVEKGGSDEAWSLEC
jgi:hypothetical protein